MQNVTGKDSDVYQPLVSVITPSFNQGMFIKETIESVLSQDYPNIEYIVIDGGSTDDTISILQDYEEKIYWISEPDEGQADAVNKGVLLAKGEIIGWLNSDDVYAPGAITKIVTAFREHPDVSVIYGEAHHVSKSGEFIERYPTEPFDYRHLAERCFICQPAAFIRKKCLLEVGMLRKELQLCLDYDLWIRIGKKSKFLFLPEHLADSRIYPENKTFSRTGEAFGETLTMVHSHYEYYPVSWVYGTEKANFKEKFAHSLIFLILFQFIYLNYPIKREFINYFWYLFRPFLKYGIITNELIYIIAYSIKKGNIIKKI